MIFLSLISISVKTQLSTVSSVYKLPLQSGFCKQSVKTYSIIPLSDIATLIIEETVDFKVFNVSVFPYKTSGFTLKPVTKKLLKFLRSFF